MIAITNLAKEFGARSLFAGVSLQLNAGSRYGLVGANGSGKSTFLRILSGDEEASDGKVSLVKRARVGVLRQDRFLDDDAIILDLVMRGDEVVWSAMTEQRLLEAADHHPDPGRMTELEDRIAAHDGYTLEARASEVLEGLAIPAAAHRAPLSTLSGGFKLRVLLAQVLAGGVDVLLLDEPTNHLDIVTIRWLEKFLAAYTGCAVIISHDQRFLDNVTSHTLDVDYQTITLYPGGYSAAMVEKAAVRARKEVGVARAEEEIARKRAFVERFGAKNTKATQAQSRLKQIERIEVEELASTSRRAPALRFEPQRPSGRDVLELRNVSKSYGAHRVLSDVSLTVRRGERVAIIGPNGLGKSTLLRIAVERLALDAGQVRWGHETHVGYFPQDHREVLDDGTLTPLDLLSHACPGESPTYVRGQLGRVLFSGEEVDKEIRLLSGGESARLIFALLAVQRPNVLVLDEPTNHLDLEAIHALVAALKEYPGAVIFVSHDRWFVSELATRVIELTPTGPNDFPGSYPDYLARCGDDHLDADAVVSKAANARKQSDARKQSEAEAEYGATGRTASEAADAPALSWEEQKRRRNRAAQLPKQRDRLLADIEVAETRKRAIHDLFVDPGFYQKTSHQQMADLEKESAALGQRIDGLLAEWEQVEGEIASLDSGGAEK